MKSNDELITYMCLNGVLGTPEIIQAFRKIDRKYFVPAYLIDEVYNDYPLPIGAGQTISQPSTVAFMLELLGVKRGDSVLDVGCGSAWSSALLGEIVGENGRVLGLERIEKLLEYGKRNLKKFGFGNLKIEKAGDRLGCPEMLFDKILVSASAENIPNELVEQLKIGGLMIIPVKGSIYRLQRVKNGEIQKEVYHGFRFVPLVY